MLQRIRSGKLSSMVALAAVALVLTACEKSESDSKNEQAKEKEAQPTEAKTPVETPAQEVKNTVKPAVEEVKNETTKVVASLVAKVDDSIKQEVKEVTKPKPEEQPKKAAGKLAPLPIVLPKKMFVGTPTNIRVENLQKPLGKPRPPFLAPIGCKNIALNKKVTSSDPEPIIGDLELMTDGDKEGIDGSWVELGPMVQWAQVDLGAKQEIYAVLFWHYHRQARAYFDVIVQVADDPDFITNVRTIFNNDLDNSAGQGIGKDMHYIETSEGKLIDAKGVKARYVRLYSNGNSANDQNHYTEIEVYGKLPGAKATPDTNKPGPTASGDKLAPLPIKLPKAMFVGTPTNIRVENLKKPLGKPRPPFLAPAGCKNVALNKKVTSSDPEPIIGDLELMTDGDKEGIDGSWVELGPMVQWAQVDLGAKQEIYAVLFWHYHRQARAYFDVIVQVADDPDFITNVRTIFNNDLDNSAGQGIGKNMHYIETSEGKLIDAKGVKARYVRLYSNGSSANDQNHYTEIEVYGKPAQ